ncbi:carbonic anhydrase 6 isoform X1 [Drosophila kikkawai]|uniref:Carbonic anhydrase n=1 Tax=Drosophila kikkawai TaxID=30033 RepID=A0A6P4J880_DROKI|nr:carbonic anhydrase 6 isoform X1 [Drosophila kikkawai]
MFLVARSFALTHSGTRSHFGYNYDKQGRDWNVKGTRRQSPIALCTSNSTTCNVPKLKMINYDKLLGDPVTVTNNGVTVLMRIPKTVEGKQPALSISTEGGHVFEAEQMHFHWGSELCKGSEHHLDGHFYDGELHIVHKNAIYKNNQEAALHRNGFAVLAVLLRHSEAPQNESPAMTDICKQVGEISYINGIQPLQGRMALEDLFVSIDPHRYLAYQGSLTTPPCAEAVLWFVFLTPVDVPHDYWRNFWQLRDSYGKRVLNTYRDLQEDYERPVYLSKGNASEM